MMQRIEKTFAGRRLVIETGRMAKQAAGSALVTFGDTMVLASVTVSEKQSPLDFFPLLVEYREKTYAAGKIPGGEDLVVVGPAPRPRDPRRPDHRPVHPAAVPRRLQERSAGVHLRRLRGHGE
jgi:polyribonucleotide nucleotidyltransferase